MNTLSKALIFTLIGAMPAVGAAKPTIFACEPEWGALAKELTGGQADIYVATTAAQDPHHIEARPSLLASARRADMLVCTGAELEAGWLPILLRESGNDKIQPGNPGYFMASDYVERLDIPEKVDRSEGDVHAAGNPHIHLDPRNIQQVAHAMASALADAFPEMKPAVVKNEEDFNHRWADAMTRWTHQAQALRNLPVFVQHTNTRYLTAWLNLQTLAALEPKPGIPPNAGHLARLLALHKKTPAKMILLAAYEGPKAAQWLSDKTALPVVTLPFTVGGDGADNLFSLFDTTLDKLLKAASAHGKH